MTYELENRGESVKLTVVHEIDRPDSRLIGALPGGWPLILSSLKSLLETGNRWLRLANGPKSRVERVTVMIVAPVGLLGCRGNPR